MEDRWNATSPSTLIASSSNFDWLTTCLIILLISWTTSKVHRPVWVWIKKDRITQDLVAVILSMLIFQRHAITSLLQYKGLDHDRLGSVVLILTVFVLGRFTSRRFVQAVRPIHQSVKKHDSRLKPTVLPCRTTHTRLFPSRHSFSYSYLFVGVPVDKPVLVGKILSADPPPGHKPTWFSVHAEDYLARGDHPAGLRGKLDDFLQSQDAQPSDFPYAYLVTAPRVLGFSFNPVSFWYLYSSGMKLTAMILEVNNTFDERRPYLLRRSAEPGNEVIFRSCWDKDFHVSPFNDREGTYSLTATNPFDSATSITSVDNNITLTAPDRRPKIVARVFSSSGGIPASDFTSLNTIWFLLKWSWVGFMTNPRILKEARVLWMRNKLKIWYRPEVQPTSIGRNETGEERAIEPVFQAYLQHMSNLSGETILYVSAAGPGRGKKTVIVPNSQRTPKSSSKIEVQVLTPEWYSTLARSTNLIADWQRYGFQPDVGEGLIRVSHPELVQRMIGDARLSHEAQGETSTFQRRFNKHLRHDTNMVGALLKAFPTSINGETKHSCFCDFVYSDDTSKTRSAAFTKASTITLLADRLSLGYSGLLRFYGRFVWLCMVWCISIHCIQLTTNRQRLKLMEVTRLAFEALILHLAGRWARYE